MLYYLLSVLVIFIVLMNSNWDVPHNITGSVRFKFLFNLISALIWPVFLVTLIWDGVIVLYRKIFK